MLTHQGLFWYGLQLNPAFTCTESCWMLFYSKKQIILRLDIVELTVFDASAPLSLFTNTDVGSITTRFSQDIGMIDNQLPLALVVTLASKCQ